MNNGIFAGGVAIGVGIWLVLSFSTSHEGERNEVRASMNRDKAEFDRDFARMTSAPKDTQDELTKRAAAEGKVLEQVRVAAEERREFEQAKRDEVQANYEKELNIDTASAKKTAAGVVSPRHMTGAQLAEKLKNKTTN